MTPEQRLSVFFNIVDISWSCVREYAPDLTVRDIEPSIRAAIARQSSEHIRYLRTTERKDGGVFTLLDCEAWYEQGVLYITMRSDHMIAYFWIKSSSVRADMPQRLQEFPADEYDTYAAVLRSTDLTYVRSHPERPFKDEKGNLDLEYDVTVHFPIRLISSDMVGKEGT